MNVNCALVFLLYIFFFVWWLSIFGRPPISLTWFSCSCRFVYLLDWLFAIPIIAIEIIAINKSEDKVGLEFSLFLLFSFWFAEDGKNLKLNFRWKRREKRRDRSLFLHWKLCIHFRLVFLLALNHDSICRLWEQIVIEFLFQCCCCCCCYTWNQNPFRRR